VQLNALQFGTDRLRQQLLQVASLPILDAAKLNAAIDNAAKHDRALHIMGLVSDGLVHSSQEHAYALLRLAKDRLRRQLGEREP